MLKTRWILLPASLLVLAACNMAAVTEPDDGLDTDTQSTSEETPFLDDDSSSSEATVIDVSSTPAATSSVAPQVQTPRVITVSVTTWSFSPNVITAKKGEKIQLRLVGGEGIHSFAVPDLGLNVRVEAGQTVTVDLPTDTTGTFGAMCRIPCGAGHQDMKATVIITE